MLLGHSVRSLFCVFGICSAFYFVGSRGTEQTLESFSHLPEKIVGVSCAPLLNFIYKVLSICSHGVSDSKFAKLQYAVYGTARGKKKYKLLSKGNN